MTTEVRPELDAAQLDAGEFYAEFTSRNRRLISDADQQRLRRSEILVAGCGSIGGAAVEPLVRLGAERFTLAEPGEYDVSNLNRQRFTLADVGRNKAAVQAERAVAINPFTRIELEEDGITDANVRLVTERAAVIIDGVDVTAVEAIQAKVALHAAAARVGVPVVCGYDVAGLQALIVYDYRRPGLRPFDGRISPVEAAGLTPVSFLARVVPKTAIPIEILGVLRELAAGSTEPFPQLVYTADLFGVLAARAVLELLAERPVRRVTVIDVHQKLRTGPQRRLVQARRLVALAKLVPQIRQAQR
jgi:molybdopterin/thiamine biosynthesis adenylyltransferase